MLSTEVAKRRKSMSETQLKDFWGIYSRIVLNKFTGSYQMSLQGRCLPTFGIAVWHIAKLVHNDHSVYAQYNNFRTSYWQTLVCMRMLFAVYLFSVFISQNSRIHNIPLDNDGVFVTYSSISFQVRAASSVMGFDDFRGLQRHWREHFSNVFPLIILLMWPYYISNKCKTFSQSYTADYLMPKIPSIWPCV